MELYNSTKYRYRAVVNGRSFNLNACSSIFFDCPMDTKIELIALDKPSVHIDWLEVIIFHMFFGSSTSTKIYTDYSFVIDDLNVEKITLANNDWTVRLQITVNAPYIKEHVSNERYSLSEFDRIKKKHRNLHLFVSSAWPLGVAMIAMCFAAEPPTLFALLFLLWLLIFAVPSLKEVKRFNEVMQNGFINDNLCEYARKRRTGEFLFADDTSKTGRFVTKVLRKLFGDDKQ